MQLGGMCRGWSLPHPRAEGCWHLPACWRSPLFSSQGRRAGEGGAGLPTGLGSFRTRRNAPSGRTGVKQHLGACASGRAQLRSGARTWRTRIAHDSRYPGCLRAGLFLLSSTAKAGREQPYSASPTCQATCLRCWARHLTSPRACAGRFAVPSLAQTHACARSGHAASRAAPPRWRCSFPRDFCTWHTAVTFPR